jgi:23S rRNA (pseudouridine1915-N3)-methyltransferase
MRLLAIGKASRGPESELFTRYAARIRPKLELLAFPDGTGTAAEIRRREAGALLAKVSSGQFLVALDQGGITVDSAGLAQLLADWHGGVRPLVFVIGGAEGLDGTVLRRADAILSLGPLTWPHMLARAMLAEQIYRAQCIGSNHPYHRAGRP